MNVIWCAAFDERVKVTGKGDTGDIITFAREQMKTEEGLNHKFTFSGPVYFDRMKRKGLYSVDVRAIEERVANAGATGVFSERA
ncbi:MAG: hypothetical protein H8E10_19990 [Desulfobacterales bacterium]|nr:hypothetical protein [Desulfobacterales bacterium]